MSTQEATADKKAIQQLEAAIGEAVALHAAICLYLVNDATVPDELVNMQTRTLHNAQTICDVAIFPIPF